MYVALYPGLLTPAFVTAVLQATNAGVRRPGFIVLQATNAGVKRPGFDLGTGSSNPLNITLG